MAGKNKNKKNKNRNKTESASKSPQKQQYTDNNPDQLQQKQEHHQSPSQLTKPTIFDTSQKIQQKLQQQQHPQQPNILEQKPQLIIQPDQITQQSHQQVQKPQGTKDISLNEQQIIRQNEVLIQPQQIIQPKEFQEDSSKNPFAVVSLNSQEEQSKNTILLNQQQQNEQINLVQTLTEDHPLAQLSQIIQNNQIQRPQHLRVSSQQNRLPQQFNQQSLQIIQPQELQQESFKDPITRHAVSLNNSQQEQSKSTILLNQQQQNEQISVAQTLTENHPLAQLSQIIQKNQIQRPSPLHTQSQQNPPSQQINQQTQAIEDVLSEKEQQKQETLIQVDGSQQIKQQEGEELVNKQEDNWHEKIEQKEKNVEENVNSQNHDLQPQLEIRHPPIQQTVSEVVYNKADKQIQQLNIEDFNEKETLDVQQSHNHVEQVQNIDSFPRSQTCQTIDLNSLVNNFEDYDRLEIQKKKTYEEQKQKRMKQFFQLNSKHVNQIQIQSDQQQASLTESPQQQPPFSAKSIPKYQPLELHVIEQSLLQLNNSEERSERLQISQHEPKQSQGQYKHDKEQMIDGKLCESVYQPENHGDFPNNEDNGNEYENQGHQSQILISEQQTLILSNPTNFQEFDDQAERLRLAEKQTPANSIIPEAIQRRPVQSIEYNEVLSEGKDQPKDLNDLDVEITDLSQFNRVGLGENDGVLTSFQQQTPTEQPDDIQFNQQSVAQFIRQPVSLPQSSLQIIDFTNINKIPSIFNSHETSQQGSYRDRINEQEKQDQNNDLQEQFHQFKYRAANSVEIDEQAYRLVKDSETHSSQIQSTFHNGPAENSTILVNNLQTQQQSPTIYPMQSLVQNQQIIPEQLPTQIDQLERRGDDPYNTPVDSITEQSLSPTFNYYSHVDSTEEPQSQNHHGRYSIPSQQSSFINNDEEISLSPPSKLPSHGSIIDKLRQSNLARGSISSHKKQQNYQQQPINNINTPTPQQNSNTTSSFANSYVPNYTVYTASSYSGYKPTIRLHHIGGGQKPQVYDVMNKQLNDNVSIHQHSSYHNQGIHPAHPIQQLNSKDLIEKMNKLKDEQLTNKSIQNQDKHHPVSHHHSIQSIIRPSPDYLASQSSPTRYLSIYNDKKFQKISQKQQQNQESNIYLSTPTIHSDKIISEDRIKEQKVQRDGELLESRINIATSNLSMADEDQNQIKIVPPSVDYMKSYQNNSNLPVSSNRSIQLQNNSSIIMKITSLPLTEEDIKTEEDNKLKQANMIQQQVQKVISPSSQTFYQHYNDKSRQQSQTPHYISHTNYQSYQPYQPYQPTSTIVNAQNQKQGHFRKFSQKYKQFINDNSLLNNQQNNDSSNPPVHIQDSSKFQSLPNQQVFSPYDSNKIQNFDPLNISYRKDSFNNVFTVENRTQTLIDEILLMEKSNLLRNSQGEGRQLQQQSIKINNEQSFEQPKQNSAFIKSKEVAPFEFPHKTINLLNKYSQFVPEKLEENSYSQSNSRYVQPELSPTLYKQSQFLSLLNKQPRSLDGQSHYVPLSMQIVQNMSTQLPKIHTNNSQILKPYASSHFKTQISESPQTKQKIHIILKPKHHLNQNNIPHSTVNSVTLTHNIPSNQLDSSKNHFYTQISPNPIITYTTGQPYSNNHMSIHSRWDNQINLNKSQNKSSSPFQKQSNYSSLGQSQFQNVKINYVPKQSYGQQLLKERLGKQHTYDRGHFPRALDSSSPSTPHKPHISIYSNIEKSFNVDNKYPSDSFHSIHLTQQTPTKKLSSQHRGLVSKGKLLNIYSASKNDSFKKEQLTKQQTEQSPSHFPIPSSNIDNRSKKQKICLTLKRDHYTSVKKDKINHQKKAFCGQHTPSKKSQNSASKQLNNRKQRFTQIKLNRRTEQDEPREYHEKKFGRIESQVQKLVERSANINQQKHQSKGGFGIARVLNQPMRNGNGLAYNNKIQLQKGWTQLKLGRHVQKGRMMRREENVGKEDEGLSEVERQDVVGYEDN